MGVRHSVSAPCSNEIGSDGVVGRILSFNETCLIGQSEIWLVRLFRRDCSAGKAALWGFVQQALATFCENPENLHQPAVRKVLGDNLLMAMGAMLEDAQPMVTAESISHQSYRRLLSRAREYVLENMSEPVTVLDLCNQLHVSRRTLQNAFHAILGIGPNAWLKRIRLNAVRRELISPWSQSTTVKDAAMQWGFWHLGQFATDYQQLFAEKPSLTLHQRMREWG